MMQGVPHPLEVLFGGGVGLACDERGEIHAEELHGLFAGDTRMLSTYRFTIGGAPLLAAQLFLGLVADVPNGRIYLCPWLPDWQPVLAFQGVEIGDGMLEVELRRVGDRTLVENAIHPSLEIVQDAPEAPLWGVPFGAPKRAAAAE
jgi:N-terminal domain of (some) glycogen debranching enzymes